MTELTKIILSLGVDYTIWIQFGIFFIVFLTMKMMVFDPYFKCYLERQQKTSGNQEKADQLFAETRELEAVYQRKMRSLNSDMKEIFDKARSTAVSNQEHLQSEAREQAKIIIETGRKKIEIEFNKAREELMRETPELGKAIVNRLLSKEAQ
jgi:F-type H+-transporting ATPase subunit b